MAAKFETDLIGAIELIRRTRLECWFVAPLGLETGHDLISRLRGAWGHAVKARAEVGSSDAQGLLHACFSTNGNEIRPYLIYTRLEDVYLVTSLTLFGSTSRWQSLAFDTFIDCLTTGRGVAFRSGKRAQFQRLHLAASHWTRAEWLDVGAVSERRRIALTSPLRIVSNGALDASCRELLPSIARRVTGLAAWAGCAVRYADRVCGDNLGSSRVIGIGLMPHMWTRNSKRQSIQQTHVGLTGQLLLTHLNPIGHALVIAGQYIGAGSEVSLGLGRYTVLN